MCKGQPHRRSVLCRPASRRCRFRNQRAIWRAAFQPMAGRKGKKTFGPAEGIAAAAKVKKPALGILRERASKLLRR